ncbi:hypothetical protein D3C73_1034670 [compost metagenome]
MLPTIPSTMIKALLLFRVPVPLMRMVAPSEPGLPDDCLTETPELKPPKEDERLVTGRFSMAFASIVATEPITFTFFCTP